MGEGSGFNNRRGRALASCFLEYSVVSLRPGSDRLNLPFSEGIWTVLTIYQLAATHRRTTVHTLVARAVTDRDRAAGITRRCVRLHLSHRCG